MTDVPALLRELSGSLDLPDAPDVRAAVRARLTAGEPTAPSGVTWRIPRLAAAVAVALALLAALAVPDVRSAIADRLGIGAVDVDTGSAPGSGGGAAPAREPWLSALASVEAATAHLGQPLLLPRVAGFEDPEIRIAGAAVLLVYRDDRGAVTAVVTELAGEGRPLLQKFVGRADVREVTVRGRRALWLSGGLHEVFVEDAAGDIVQSSGRLAGDTLIWTAGPLTLRLESSLPLERALEVAESMQPAPVG